MKANCPGAGFIRTPTLSAKECPECGREIELFSVDPYRQCECGFIAYNDVQSCLQWCKHAQECVGDEVYEQFMRRNDS